MANELKSKCSAWVLAALCITHSTHSSLAFAQDSADPPPPPANASAEVTRLNEAGTELYKVRDYRRAVEKFIEAYSIDHDPNLLFNIGRCYEQLGETEAAIEKYEEFLKTPGADTEGRQRAEESLVKLRQLLLVKGQEQEPAGTSPEPAPAAPSNNAQSNPAAVSSTSSSNLWAWVALGGGVLFTAGGATSYLLGRMDHDEVESASAFNNASQVHPLTRQEAQDLVDAGDTKKWVGVAGMSLGGALLVTSAVLFITGGQNQEQPSVSVAPSSDGAFFSYSGSF